VHQKEHIKAVLLAQGKVILCYLVQEKKNNERGHKTKGNLKKKEIAVANSMWIWRGKGRVL